MKNMDLIEKLRSESTWKLLGLGIVTYGVYFAYYAQRQSKEINTAINSDDNISSGFINSMLVMSYVSLALLIPYLFVEEGHPIEGISSLIDMIVSIMLIVWGFKARNRVNTYCGFGAEGGVWFHGLWTFLFTPLYFNYKVNCILESNVEQAAPADS